jgi:hypothetical protein
MIGKLISCQYRPGTLRINNYMRSKTQFQLQLQLQIRLQLSFIFNFSFSFSLCSAFHSMANKFLGSSGRPHGASLRHVIYISAALDGLRLTAGAVHRRVNSDVIGSVGV